MQIRMRYLATYLGAASVLGGIAVAPVANAEEVANQPEEIVITGSRLARSEVDSVGPITVLDDAALKSTGYSTVENMVQDLPFVTGADFGSTTNNGSDGLATVSLRGLGPNRTLVLIDGHRIGNAGVDGIADLNSVPSAMIERIEVLRDGATAVYGSDAIAGVINIITKKDFEGADFGMQYDITGDNDGDQYAYSMVLGSGFEKGHFSIGAQYTKRDPIWQKDRKFSECPYFDDGTQKFCGGSPNTAPPQIVYPNDATAQTWVVDQSTGQVRLYDDNTDAYNYAAVSYLGTPQTVWSAFASGNYTLLEDSNMGSTEAYMQVSFSNRQSDQLLAPTATFWGVPVPTTNPYNPFGDALCATNPACTAGPQEVFISRRLVEGGGREYTQNVDNWRVLFGLQGDLPNNWHWDMSYNYADGNDSQRDGGNIIQPRTDQIADPAACAADPACPGVWNPFSVGTLTPAMQNYILVAPNTINRDELKVGQINLTGDIPAFQLPGGDIEWSVGFERRSESAASLPDAGAAIGAIYFYPGEKTKGAYNVNEYYGEMRFPLLSGQPFAETLAAEVAGRYSDYNNQNGGRSTWRYALEWAPISDVRLRGVYAEGFRAPNIGELYGAVQLTAATYADPCANYGANPDPVIQANCAADGLPPTFSLATYQALAKEGGNANLEPETSKSWTYGLVYTPSQVAGLSFTVDYFDIEIDNAVGTAGASNIINDCYNSVNFSSPLCALLVGPAFTGEAPSPTAPTHRNNQQQVSGLELRNVNISTFETKGYDITANYGFDTRVGRVDLRWIGTYLDQYDYLPYDGGTTLQYAGKYANDPYFTENIATFPDWQFMFISGLSRDTWGATLITRFMQATKDINANPANLSNTTPSVWYFDVQGYYTWDKVTFTAGVRNLMDYNPPYVSAYDDMNTLNASFDTAGRYFYGRIGVKL